MQSTVTSEDNDLADQLGKLAMTEQQLQAAEKRTKEVEEERAKAEKKRAKAEEEKAEAEAANKALQAQLEAVKTDGSVVALPDFTAEEIAMFIEDVVCHSAV
jgi:stalled ribosome rescue protein Dom34